MRQVTPGELVRTVKQAKEDIIPDLKKSLMKEAMRTRNEIIKLTPVDTGLLRTSNRVDSGIEGNVIRIAHLNNQVYAAVQHESEDFVHRVGQWKFVEIPFLRAIPLYKKAIIDTMVEDLNGQI